MSVPTYSAMVSDKLDKRQQSLFAILDAAVESAATWNVPVYVLHAPVYVDEFAEGEHVYAGKEACLILFPKGKNWNETGVPWAIDARVEPDGKVFITHMTDILHVVGHTLSEQRRLDIQLVDIEEVTR